MTAPLRWGLLGLGKIANHFANDLALLGSDRLYACASRTTEKAQQFAKEHNVKQAYGSYEEMVRDPKVDIVYIATPHSNHYENTMLALNAGKHVLCEKPIGINTQQAGEMYRLAKSKQLFLMEGMWTRFNPAFQYTYHMVQKGALGDLKYIYADFAFNASDKKEGRLFDPALAGGALLDIGIYPLFLAYSILGPPLHMTPYGTMANGVDLSGHLLLEYDLSIANLYYSLEHKTQMDAKIAGTKGEIVLKNRFHETNELHIILDDKEEAFSFDLIGRGYAAEAQECEKCIAEKRQFSSLWSPKDSLNLISMMDQIRLSIGLKYPIE